MSFSLSQLGQVALTVINVDIAETFYATQLGLRKLFRFGDLAFFSCGDVRLLLEKGDAQKAGKGSALYFRCADIGLAHRELQSRGVIFTDEPHLIAPMEDHDLWMTFFNDPDGNTLALMMEAPKGYQPT